MSKKIPCSYFSKDGFCAKGDFCDFLHYSSASEKRIHQCQFFQTKAGCRYGNSCAFMHKNQANSVLLERKKVISTAQQLPAGYVLLGKSQFVENNETSNIKLTSSEMWGLDDDINDDGSYFYGAPGTAPIASKKYADIVGRISSTPLHFESKTDMREPCTFFLAGNCRYGDICKNLHPNMDFIGLDEKIVLQEEESLAKEVNCGICLQPAEDGRLGILSHCDCIFCLKCIREWRKEGTAISKSDVVR